MIDSIQQDRSFHAASDRYADRAIGNRVRPLRVLHLLGGLNRGGIETWLMHVLRHADRERLNMDFFVRGAAKGQYEEEIESHGCKIGRTLSHRHPLKFAQELQVFVRENGPYDVLHSHLSEYDGLVLWMGARMGLKVRISHSHNDVTPVENTI